MSKKIVSIALAITTMVWMFGPAGAATVEEMTAQIAELMASIKLLQDQLQQAQGVTCYSFKVDLKYGSRGVNVTELQKVLIAGAYLDIAAPTAYFGSLTKAAVVKYQEAKGVVLKGTGYVGSLTRAELNKCVVVPTPTPTATPTPTPTATPTPTPTPTTTPTSTPITAALTVALAADNPLGATLPKNANNVELLKVKLTGGATSTTVTAMKFKRFGAGLPGDWDALYVYADGIRLVATGRTISADNQEVEFPVISLAVPAGTDVILSLRGTVGITGAEVTGGQHYFGLTTLTTTATVTGLPVNSNTFTVGSVTASIVTVAIGVAPINPSVGQAGAEIGQVKLTAGTEDVSFKEVIVSLTGSLARSAVTNIKLYYESTLLASAANVGASDTITLVLSTPYTLTKGQSRVFSMKADLGGRVGETLTTKIEEASHLTVIDKVYNVGAGLSFTAPLSLATITLQGGTITLVDNGPVAGYIGKNLQDVVLTKFAVTSQRNIEVRRLAINLTRVSSSSVIAIDTTDIADLRLKDVGSGATLMTFTIPDAFYTTAGATVVAQVTSTDIFNLATAVTRNLAITVDIGTDTDLDLNSMIVRANLVQDIYAGTEATEQVYIRDVTTGDYLYTKDIVPSSVTGDNQTVRAAGISSTLASTPTNTQVVKGATAVESVGVVFTATDASDITIRQIQARVYVSTDTTIADNNTGEVTTPRDVITQVKLYDGATLLSAKTLSNVSATGHDYGVATFDNLSVVVSKGSTKKLVVQTDITTALTANRYYATAILGAGVSAYDADANLLTVSTDVNALTSARYNTILTGGTLTVVKDAASPVSDIVLAGTTGNLVSKFKFTAADEQFTVNKLKVRLMTEGNEGSISKVTVAYPSGSKEGYLSTSGSTSSAAFTSVGWIIPKNTTAILDVKVDTKVIDQNQDETGRAILMGIIWNDGFEAIGESQTVTTTIVTSDTLNDTAIVGSAMSLRKSKPTIATNAYAGALLNQETNLYQFNVTAAQDAVTLKQFGFNLTVAQGTTGTTTIGSFVFYKGGVAYTSADLDITAYALAAGSLATTTVGATTATSGSESIVVAFKDTKEVEIAAGETITFTLKGLVQGIDQTGDAISIRLAPAINTTDLAVGKVFRYSGATQLAIGTAANGATYRNLIWSDRAKGINHNSTEGTGGSLDWANDTYPLKTAGSYWTYTK